jgi:hypothetical protein
MSAQLQPEMDFIGPRPLAGHCKYRLETTCDNSAKYGLCEVCREHASEVFMQTEVVGSMIDTVADGPITAVEQQSSVTRPV